MKSTLGKQTKAHKQQRHHLHRHNITSLTDSSYLPAPCDHDDHHHHLPQRGEVEYRRGSGKELYTSTKEIPPKSSDSIAQRLLWKNNNKYYVGIICIHMSTFPFDAIVQWRYKYTRYLDKAMTGKGLHSILSIIPNPPAHIVCCFALR